MHVRVFGLLSLLMITLGATWKGTDNTVPTGPYALQYPASFGGRFTIPTDNPMTQEGVYLGRLLFYEPRLSKTNTISCGSCHQQERAFTDGKAVSMGVSGKPTSRNSMSLANLLWVRQFFWDGRASSLEEQARIPLAHPDEMGMAPEEAAHTLQKTTRYPPLFRRVFGSDTITDTRISKAIAQFERTLISANSRYDRSMKGQYTLTEAEQRGLRLFSVAPNSERGIRGGNCAHCHGGPKLYQELFHNNGLDQVASDAGRETVTGIALDHGRFRVPTLRNVALTAPYMHDGRFATLEAVVDHYSDHIQPSPSLSRELMAGNGATTGFHLTPGEKSDLVAFLRTLTDTVFITNPQFANPHIANTASKRQAITHSATPH